MQAPDLSQFGPFRSGGGCGSDTVCVEVADGPDGWKAIRDSKLGDASPVLTFSAEEWRVFTSAVRAGEFD